jgi:N-acetylmuramoyl-L-alanine amidase
MGNSVPDVYDPGAVSDIGEEAKIVLDMGVTLKWMITGDGLLVWMTRQDAITNSPLDTRPSRANANACTRYLALHMNSFDGTATGTETYYRSQQDKVWAEAVHSIALNAFELPDRGLKTEKESNRGRLKVFDFDGPCCLCELGFIDNDRDFSIVSDRTRRIAFATGISAYLKGLMAK